MSVGICSVLEKLEVFFRESRRAPILLQQLVVEACIVVRTQAVHQRIDLREANVATIRYRRFPQLPSFGRNQDNAVGCFRTVDGCRSRVFQDGDRLDIVRIEGIECPGFDTVHQDVWVGIVQRTDTAHTDSCRIRSRLSGSRCNRYTWCQTLQGGGYVRYRAVQQLVVRDGADGSRQVNFRLRTISDYYNFVQRLGILAEGDAERLFTVNFNFCCVITYIGNLKYVSRCYLKREIAVDVGYHTICRPFHQDICADDRNSMFINYITSQIISILLTNPCRSISCICRSEGGNAPKLESSDKT